MTLPQGWAEASFADIANHRSGNGKLIKGTLEDQPGEGLFPAFSASGQDVWRDAFEQEGEAIIVSAVGARCGKAFRASGKWSAIANTHIVWPEVEAVDAKFLYLILNDEEFWEKGGTAQPFVKVGATFEKAIALPPLAEQRRIIAKLDALTARLDRARAELDRVSVLARNLRKETLRNAFAHEAPAVPVGELIADIRYGTAKKCDYGGGAVPVLRIPNVQGGRIDLGDMKSADFDPKELAKLRLQSGDILVIRSNGSLDLVGRSAIVDKNAAGMLFAGYLIRMRVEPTNCLPEYLHHFLQSPAARDTITMAAKSTSGVNNVNSQQLQALAVPLPDLSTQRNLIDQIEHSFARADRLEAEAVRARALLDRLESAILAKAFRGELVPQDPQDEPASVLLDRIRAGRAAAPKTKRGSKAQAA